MSRSETEATILIWGKTKYLGPWESYGADPKNPEINSLELPDEREISFRPEDAYIGQSEITLAPGDTFLNRRSTSIPKTLLKIVLEET